MSTDTMKQWRYITEIPDGEGGSKPHAVGQIIRCERCSNPYMVTNTPTNDECTYHWGKPFTKTINGTSHIDTPSSFGSDRTSKARNSAYTRVVQRPHPRTVVREDFTSFMNRTQLISTSVILFRSHDPSNLAMTTVLLIQLLTSWP